METWDEDSSALFGDYGELFTPRREEIQDAILRLIPASPHQEFVIADIGCGTGWLLDAILARFPKARAIGWDGSAVMLGRAEERLKRYGTRVSLRPFRLESEDWRNEIGDVRCFVSTLAIHHLYAAQKIELFRVLKKRLQVGGALILADLVLPVSALERQYFADSWDAAVVRQSQAASGDLSGFQVFQAEEWNYYLHPDDMVDHPSPLVDQLDWLRAAGYSGVDVFWMLAGHAVFGGFNI